MQKEEFDKKLKQYLVEIGIIISEEKSEKLYQYMLMILEWNKKINLTAIIEPEEIIVKHFVDSFTINQYIKENTSLIDVGTGAGFPGIPLGILREDIKITLIDSLNKRVVFLEEAIKRLELYHIKAVHTRAEDLASIIVERENYDIATSRAVANMSTLLEYMLPLVKIDGICLCMKGSNIEKEIEESEKAISVLGGKIEHVEEFYLPLTDIKRNIIKIKKIRNTPKQFPRKQGRAKKEPIK